MHVQVQIAAAGVYWEIECESVVVYYCMLVLIPSLCVYFISEYNLFQSSIIREFNSTILWEPIRSKVYSYSNNTAPQSNTWMVQSMQKVETPVHRTFCQIDFDYFQSWVNSRNVQQAIGKMANACIEVLQFFCMHNHICRTAILQVPV